VDGQKLAELEYEALQAEKRDKLNGRVQIWSLFFGLVSGAGLVSVQAGTVSSLIALYPFLAMCLARYTGHSERVLDQLKGRLLAIERARGFMGYEEVNRGNARHRQSGSQLKAFRDAVLVSQVAATALVVLRMPVLWAGIALALVEVALIEMGFSPPQTAGFLTLAVRRMTALARIPVLLVYSHFYIIMHVYHERRENV